MKLFVLDEDQARLASAACRLMWAKSHADDPDLEKIDALASIFAGAAQMPDAIRIYVGPEGQPCGWVERPAAEAIFAADPPGNIPFSIGSAP